jgi:hypothetical protein
MKKNIWIFGTIAGLISTSWMLVVITTGACHDMQYGEILGYSTMIIAFSMIFVGVKNYRDKQNNGVITFGKAFKMGLFMTLIAATMYVVVWAIDYNFFATDFMEKYLEAMITKLKAKGLAQAELDKQVADLKNMREMYRNPIFFTLITYAEIVPTGLLLSLISALILKKKPAA